MYENMISLCMMSVKQTVTTSKLQIQHLPKVLYWKKSLQLKIGKLVKSGSLCSRSKGT